MLALGQWLEGDKAVAQSLQRPAGDGMLGDLRLVPLRNSLLVETDIGHDHLLDREILLDVATYGGWFDIQGAKASGDFADRATDVTGDALADNLRNRTSWHCQNGSAARHRL